ncbi:EcsC family protein [Bacillus lacus]|uniref:EcsC family protein n=1 Tax=Metabacillus lacus TaxID=1983721 RepID=A0A7X2LY62_9BACI|nr:EcsC family protein [Metabacillus lacus]MRX71453.1 EcsC family protein [Metabacillus lacus]
MYETAVKNEINLWKLRMLRKGSRFQRMSKAFQNKVNDKLPEKLHQAVTASIRKMVEATVIGSHATTYQKDTSSLTLQQRDGLAADVISKYQKAAALEGAGTGAGGILLGMADFPLLLSIKMKCLFELSGVYGFHTGKKEERYFLLYIFQLAFSREDKRAELFDIIENWDQGDRDKYLLNWQDLQQEYRDHIDLVKMLQVLPGVGAVVGGTANYQLIAHLGECAVNCFRIRLLKGSEGFSAEN